MGLPDVCRPRCGTLVRCSDPATDCRPFAGSLGRCVPVSHDPTFGVCAYPSVGVTYCGTASLDPITFARCHTRPDGSPTSDYFEGNCDEDSCPNGQDTMPCVTDRLPCGARDLTLACSVAPPIDSGEPDAGTRDAGGTEDASAAMDASLGDASAVMDASLGGDASDEDARAVDAALAREDAAMTDGSNVRPFSFGGGGGCRCAVGAGRIESRNVLAIAGLLFLLAVRRRRRY